MMKLGPDLRRPVQIEIGFLIALIDKAGGDKAPVIITQAEVFKSAAGRNLLVNEDGEARQVTFELRSAPIRTVIVPQEAIKA